LQSILISVNNF